MEGKEEGRKNGRNGRKGVKRKGGKKRRMQVGEGEGGKWRWK